MALPPIVTDLTSGVIQTEITGDVVVIGAVEQGDPNTGGSDSWHTLDNNSAAMLTALQAIQTSNAATLAILTDVYDATKHTLKVTQTP